MIAFNSILQRLWCQVVECGGASERGACFLCLFSPGPYKDGALMVFDRGWTLIAGNVRNGRQEYFLEVPLHKTGVE